MIKESLKWSWKSFTYLSKTDLYKILRLRIEVFVVEQKCAYQDLDDLDQESNHLMAMNEKGQLIAYLRLIPPGLKFKEPSLSRIITSQKKKYRGVGLGKELIFRGIKKTKYLYPDVGNRIGAQKQLVDLYESLGFQISGLPYLEDGITHVQMVLSHE